MLQIDTLNRIPNKTDVALYAVGALLGLAIVVSNYYLNVVETSQVSPLEQYMERIITRMDAVSGQLGTWGAIDIRKELGGY